MKVLLISPNRERVPDPVFPLGLAYIGASLKKAGHEVEALDLLFEDDLASAIKDRIGTFKPELVGLSLRNIDDVSYPKCVCYLDLYREVVRSIRANTGAPIVLGGAGLTIMPEAFLEELDADYAIVGEGEETIVRFADDLQAGILPGEKIIRSVRSETPLWTGMLPDRELFDSGKYYKFGGMLNIQTKRGCPFGCIYCSYPLIEGKKFRMRQPESVADELEMVVERTGVRHFFFVDSIFNHPADYAGKICDAIISRGLDIRWTCYGNPACMTEELAEKMRRAGCTSIEFGTDSLLDDTLSALKKGFTFEQVQRASVICRETGIKYCHFIFIGVPGDTMDRVKLNLEKLDSLGADVSVIMTGIRIFPGTPLASIAERELGIPPTQVSIRPVYYIAPGVIREMDPIVEYIKANHPKWILPGFEININERLQSLLRRAGIKGSLWEEFTNR